MSLDNTPADAAEVGSVQAEARTTTTDRPRQTRPARTTPRPRPSIDTWAPDESVSKITQELELGSQLLKRNWRSMSMRVQITTYMLQRILPAAGLVGPAQEVEALVEARLDKLETELEAAMEELRVIAKKDDRGPMPTKDFTGALKVDVPIYTPIMARFLRLVRNLDTYIYQIDFLWMNGAIKTAHQWELLNEWRKKIWAEVTFLQAAWSQARKALREHQRREGVESTPSDESADAILQEAPAAA